MKCEKYEEIIKAKDLIGGQIIEIHGIYFVTIERNPDAIVEIVSLNIGELRVIDNNDTVKLVRMKGVIG